MDREGPGSEKRGGCFQGRVVVKGGQTSEQFIRGMCVRFIS